MCDCVLFNFLKREEKDTHLHKVRDLQEHIYKVAFMAKVMLEHRNRGICVVVWIEYEVKKLSDPNQRSNIRSSNWLTTLKKIRSDSNYCYLN